MEIKDSLRGVAKGCRLQAPCFTGKKLHGLSRAKYRQDSTPCRADMEL